MARGKRRRSWSERHDSITRNLYAVMAETCHLDPKSISDSTPLGPKYLDILNAVALQQGRPPFKNHASVSKQTSFGEAISFLMTAIQS